MSNLQRKIKTTTESSQTSVIINDENTVNSYLEDSEVPVSDEIKLPTGLTAVRATDISSASDYANITSRNAVEKDVLLDSPIHQH